MVDVSSQNNSVSINVSSSGNSASIKASPDTAQYYSEKSREWAISNRIVDGVDYSSKYYANKANENALNAKNFAQLAQNTYDQFNNSIDSSLSDINNSVESAIATINTKNDEAIDSINNTKTTILNDIEFVADGEKKEIEDLIDNGKEELKESIDGIKVLTTLEIGDIGIAPLGIDESKGKRRYLNGQLIIQEQYVQFTNKVKSAVALYPSLACTEQEWQATALLTVGGQVGKFVVDDDAGTIRLPKIIMPIQGLTDLSKLGEIVSAGLPQHTHTRGTMNITGYGADNAGTQMDSGYSGAMYRTTTAKSATRANYSGVANSTGTTAFDASRSWTGATSNANYTSSLATTNTVQQEQIQYTYFIQVATGAETEDNIINEIELNNPFSLLDYKFSEYELNNISWLRSNGQYNSKAIYPAVYDLLLKIYNGTETKAGVSVKLSTETFTDYDFVLNTAEETFRLPFRTKDDCVVEEYQSGLSWYRVYKSGWIEQGGYHLFSSDTWETRALLKPMKDTKYNVLATLTGSDDQVKLWKVGSEAKNTTTTVYLAGYNTYAVRWFVSGWGAEIPQNKTYFYVGETVQNANLINAGRIEEKVASLIPDNSSIIAGYAMPSSKYIDLTLGASGTAYTAPANGWVVFRRTATAVGQILQITNNTRCAIQIFIQSGRSSGVIGGYIPVQKGDKFTVAYELGSATNQIFRFIYAEGEQ